MSFPPIQPVTCTPRTRVAMVSCRARMAAAALGVALSLVASPARAQFDQPNVVPAPARGLAVTDRRGEQIPTNLAFTTSDGDVVLTSDLFDGSRPVVLVFMYMNCPVVCPTVMDQTFRTFNELQFTLGEEYKAIFVSIDPGDTPKRLAEAREAALLSYDRPKTDAVRAGLTYLTGDSLTVRALADAVGFPYRYLSKSQEYSHATGIFLLTPDGRVSRFLGGLEFPARDVRLGLVEAGEGRIGSLFDSFTLFCFHFDPNEGSYTLAAFRVMQIGGTLTAVLLGSLVITLFVHERRKRRRAARNDQDAIPNSARLAGQAR